jgi:predicted ArsR family transcriptional regulator
MDTPQVSPELEALAALLEPRRRRLYRFLERQPDAVSRDQAAAALGISRSLAAFHLDKLVVAGLLETEYRRLSGRSGPGAGRTSKLYRRSRQQVSLSLPHRDHELLARLLAESTISDPIDEAIFESAREYGRTLGTKARNRDRVPPAPAQLLTSMEGILDDLGFEPYRSSAAELRLRNCPFDPLSREYTPLVCGVGQAVMTGVAEGVGQDRLQVRREPHPDRCCGVISLSS